MTLSITNCRTFQTLADLRNHTGIELGPGPWVTIEQPRIDAFAQASGDDFWIHTDVVRAARELPRGSTISHGYLSLSMMTALSQMLWRVESLSQALLYGVEACRFPAPVPVGARVRLIQRLLLAERSAPDALRVTWQSTLELDGSSKPACSARTISLLFEHPDRDNS
jgi:acyl dehydratase